MEAAQYNAAPLIGGGVPQSSLDNTISDAAARLAMKSFRITWAISASAAACTTTGIVCLEERAPIYNLSRRPWPANPSRHIIYGEVYVDIGQKPTQSSLGSNTSAPDYGGRLVWNVTRLTTLTFNGLRTFITGVRTPQRRRRPAEPVILHRLSR